jgi:DNA-binding Xre family transcriptional regulator
MHVFGPKRRYSERTSVQKVPLLERVRHRFRRMVDDKDVSHDQLAKVLGLSRSGVTRLLNDEGSGFALQHVERLCEFFQVTPAEVMVEPGALIQPLVPLESAILDVVRKMDRLRQHSLLDVLEWPRASSLPSKKSRVDALNSEEAMVLSLYRAISDSDAQAGIVMQMRGYVQARLEHDTDVKRGKKS